MKTCIFTVIKNEHLYLEEWIKYHLDLGIDHLFIYEDVDSESHKEITDKYPQVTLGSILNVINPKRLNHVLTMKQHGCRVQGRYNIDGLLHISKLKEYDWCFALDSDEYITLTDTNKSITDILSEFEGYDAVVLQWENYGANGLIHMPDYSEKGLIDTYTKTCNNIVDKPYKMTKTCYKLNKFGVLSYHDNHQPSDVCKWCRTDFSVDRDTPVFDKMYLRHYITKSWDEYYNKLCVRGMFCRGHRKLDDFFILNPDLAKYKDELIQE
jgi:hypothetical protein